jgi:hypothetical protein
MNASRLCFSCLCIVCVSLCLTPVNGLIHSLRRHGKRVMDVCERFVVVGCEDQSAKSLTWVYLVKTDEFLSLFFVLRLGSEDKPSWPGGLCQKCRLGIFEFEVLWNTFEFLK